MRQLAVAFAFLSSISAAWAEPRLELKGRSIPDMCQFIYRIETDFALSFNDDHVARGSTLKLVYAFSDAYGKDGDWLDEQSIELKQIRTDLWATAFTEESMAVSKKRLFHDMNFYFEITSPEGVLTRSPSDAGLVYTTKFSGLMNKCYNDGRNSAPFLDLEIGSRETP